MTGLAIRIQKGTASWYYKTRTKKASIAPLAAFGVEDLSKLRGVVAKAREMEKLGQNPIPLFREIATSKDAEAVIQKAAVAAGEAMTWETLRDRFLKEARLEPETIRGYRSALGATDGPITADFEPMNGKPCASITVRDVQKVLSSILARGKETGGKNAYWPQARLTLYGIRSAMSWALSEDVDSGLTDNVAKRASLPKKSGASAYDQMEDDEPEDPRVLTLEECRKIIAAAHAYGNVAVGRAILLQLYTGQRRMTVVQCRRRLITEAGDGTICWRVGPDKADKYRLIPLRDRASAVARSCISAGREVDRWLFPMFRPRRAGGRDDHHMSERLLSRFMETIRTRKEPSSPHRGQGLIPFGKRSSRMSVVISRTGSLAGRWILK